MPDERDQADGTRARQLETGHTRHVYNLGGRIVEIDVAEMTEDDYARCASALGPAHTAARLRDRIRVVRLIT